MSVVESSNKRIAKNTVMLYIRMLISMFVGLYTSRVVLQTLGAEDYGIYGVVGGVVGMMGFLNASMSIATSRFITFEMGRGDLETVRKTFSTSLIIHIIIAAIVVAISETVGLWFLNNKLVIPSERMIAANWVFQCSIVSVAVGITQSPYSAVIMSNEKMDIYAYFELLNVTLKLLIVYLLLIGNFDHLILYSLLSLAVSILMCTLYRIYCLRHFTESHFSFVWDKHKMKEMMGFCFWNLFGEFSNVGMAQGLSMMLNMYFGALINAARTIADQVLGLINGFVVNFTVAISPQITKSFSSGNSDRVGTLINVGSKFTAYLYLLFALPIFLEAESILSFWLGDYPEHTIAFVRIALIIAFINTLSQPLIMGIRASGKIRNYQIVISAINLLILPLGYIALEMGQNPELVMTIQVMLYAADQCFRIWICHRLVHFSISQYFKQVLMRITVVSSIAVILPSILYLNMEKCFMSTIIVLFSSALSVFLCIVLFGLSSLERSFILSKMSLLKQKVNR